MTDILKETKRCPICGENNQCCYSEDASSICWCSEEVFPKEIFELVPVDLLKRTCICKNCLSAFIREK
ncbi:cysteine-rich CWC family protein [Heyndrickxia vini]|uniref:Cysteine-rich CWC family protein n=1 Tax=Heyndrickxia vini TaxID=1476025 RepID=A0ABX7DW64_9BACI|nr:cysteine-rich CWC family protein [Heyndrickxia vini]QQZ07733.1 cysteine-rich CWC family protein [Heyndrickxia vini]